MFQAIATIERRRAPPRTAIRAGQPIAAAGEQADGRPNAGPGSSSPRGRRAGRPRRAAAGRDRATTARADRRAARSRPTAASPPTTRRPAPPAKTSTTARAVAYSGAAAAHASIRHHSRLQRGADHPGGHRARGRRKVDLGGIAMEIIIANDGSSDGTRRAIDERSSRNDLPRACLPQPDQPRKGRRGAAGAGVRDRRRSC